MKKLLCVIVLLGAAGCSPSPEGSAPDTMARPAYPACDATWVVGKVLPDDYGLCTLDDGSLEPGVSYCDDVFVRDGMAARANEVIESKTFDAVLEGCS